LREGGFHVKHPSRIDLESILAEQLGALGLVLEQGAVESSVDFLLTVLRLNATINLTRITDPVTAVRLHLVDSLAAYPEVSQAGPGQVLDIGTGGGFPGAPLAIASGRRTVLLDSVAKKAVATEAALRECRLEGVSARAGRAESLAREMPASFAVVVARAVAPLPSLVELAAPLLVDGGVLVALKGSPSQAEVDSGDRVAALVGLKCVGTRSLTLPDGNEQRTIVSYEKEGPGTLPLPRREGLAQHNPLA
jgi:16S rRNA (guanine527-N7)-methyltransferase